MAITYNPGNYVKFLRGSVEAFNALENKSSDILYFISNTGDQFGKLYLGSKLIADGGLKSATSIEDIQGLEISNPTDKSLLMYDFNTNNWKNISVLDVLQDSPIYQGATKEKNGIAGFVPVASTLEKDLFLKGDGSWADPLVDSSALQTVVAQEVAKVVDGAPEGFDTLKEIAVWIGNHKDAADVTLLTEKVGNLDEILNGVAANPEKEIEERIGLVTKVSNLTEIIDNIQTNEQTQNNAISELQDTLKWQDFELKKD